MNGAHRWVVPISLLWCTLSTAAPTPCSRANGISDSARGALIAAAYAQAADVELELLAEAACTPILFESLKRLNPTYRFIDEKAGYTQILLPKSKVLQVLDVPGLLAAAPDTANPFADPEATVVVPVGERKPAPVPPITLPYPQVATTLPEGGPYFAAAEAGLTDLWRLHPEADGRGVRVAVLDGGIDLLHPALLLAKDREGHSVPKVADVTTLSTPDQDSGWVQFGEPIQTVSGGFDAAGRHWIAPYEGAFRFGLYTRKMYLNGGNSGVKEYEHSVTSVVFSVGVVWNEETDRIWVDTDGDGSFANQIPLGDFATTHAVDYFGRKDGENDNRVPFGIKINHAKRAAYLTINDYGHGTYVAGALAANRMTGGLFEGAAPSAQLIDVRTRTADDLTPAMLSSFARADVDVLNRSGWLGLPPADDYYDSFFHANVINAFRSAVTARAIAVYDKPVACYCGTANALHVLDYQSAEMLRRNRRSPPPYGEAINGGIWFVPDGLVDTVLAPSSSLVTESRYMPIDIPAADGRAHVTADILSPPAPAGYGIGANPSPTIPVVSGVLADLISEARVEHIRYNAIRITQAVFTGTRLVDGFPLSDQGFGLVNAAGAWQQLTRMASADDPHNPVLTWFTVAHEADGVRREVNGLHADLPASGGTVRGELWITRHGGFGGGRPYRFTLRGDDRTFTLIDQHAVLKREQPTRVRFSAQARAGMHLSLLQLTDESAGVVMQEIPLTLRAADEPEILAPGVERYQRTIPPLRTQSLYVHVGKEVQAVRYSMRIPYDGPSGISVRSMPGFIYGANGVKLVATAPPPGDPLDAAHHVGPMEDFESLVANTGSGTQEIAWGNRGAPEYATPYDPPGPDVPINGTVEVRKYALKLKRRADHALQVRNQLAAVDGKVEFYTAVRRSENLAGTGAHALATLDLKVPAHLSQWRVQVFSTAVQYSGIDALLLNCTGKAGCTLAAQRSLSPQGATFAMDEPEEGDWKLVLRARKRLKSAIIYSTHEAGLTRIEDAAAAPGAKHHPSGSVWRVALPAFTSDALYAAFSIIGAPNQDERHTGVRVAMTALTAGAP